MRLLHPAGAARRAAVYRRRNHFAAEKCPLSLRRARRRRVTPSTHGPWSHKIAPDSAAGSPAAERSDAPERRPIRSIGRVRASRRWAGRRVGASRRASKARHPTVDSDANSTTAVSLAAPDRRAHGRRHRHRKPMPTGGRSDWQEQVSSRIVAKVGSPTDTR